MACDAQEYGLKTVFILVADAFDKSDARLSLFDFSKRIFARIFECIFSRLEIKNFGQRCHVADDTRFVFGRARPWRIKPLASATPTNQVENKRDAEDYSRAASDDNQ